MYKNSLCCIVGVHIAGELQEYCIKTALLCCIGGVLYEYFIKSALCCIAARAGVVQYAEAVFSVQCSVQMYSVNCLAE